MNPLFLGTSGRRIFGVYEPAAQTSGAPRAAVICNPWGNEYVYAHRSLRHLAVRLSRSGCHTLRFDYFGTGDSAGDETETDFSGLARDIESAMETVKDIAGTPRVALIGLRLGANIAAQVASRLPDEIESLVLWDPILPAFESSPDIEVPPPAKQPYTRQSQVIRDLRVFDMESVLDSLPDRSLILFTQSETPDAAPTAAEELGRAAAPRFKVEAVPGPFCWLESITTSGALPVRIIQRIEEWLR